MKKMKGEKKRVNTDKIVCENVGPGPGAYMLPPTVGYKNHDPTKWKEPAVTIARKPTSKVPNSDIPAPIYNTRDANRYGKPCHPGVTIKGRFDLTQHPTPGPGTYSPEKHPFPLKYPAPAFSLIGKDHRPPKAYDGPGPIYKVPTALGRNVPDMKSAPAVRITTKVPWSIPWSSPGPAAYNPPNMDATRYIFPAVSMGKRVYKTTEGQSPGPLAYNPKPNVLGRTSPKFSFGVRGNPCLMTLAKYGYTD